MRVESFSFWTGHVNLHFSGKIIFRVGQKLISAFEIHRGNSQLAWKLLQVKIRRLRIDDVHRKIADSPEFLKINGKLTIAHHGLHILHHSRTSWSIHRASRTGHRTSLPDTTGRSSYITDVHHGPFIVHHCHKSRTIHRKSLSHAIYHSSYITDSHYGSFIVHHGPFVVNTGHSAYITIINHGAFIVNHFRTSQTIHRTSLTHITDHSSYITDHLSYITVINYGPLIVHHAPFIVH